MRSRLPSAMLFAIITAAASLTSEPSSTPSGSSLPIASITGELAFSDAIIFDYDRDGTPDRVQFWIELEALQAIGTPGDPGSRDESGSVRYFVMDLERNRRIDDWLLGFNMSGGFPVAGEPYPITDIRITGRTAQFDLRGSRWTITDKGDSWDKDSIEIETGGRVRKARFYGGDLTVIPGPPAPSRSTDVEADERRGADAAVSTAPVIAKPADASAATNGRRDTGSHAQVATEPQVVLPPADIKANRRCVKCHAEAAGTVAAYGGQHGEFECVVCHTRHPREVKNGRPLCLNCHNSHGESITMRFCSSCHSSHDVTKIEYGIEVPDAHCNECHKKAASRLAESGTRHMGLSCVLCHRSEHGAIPSCVDCHGGPHPKRVMSKPDRCVKCHNSAHETEVDR